MKEIDCRRSFTSSKIKEIQSKLVGSVGLVDGKACVYATGSFGRLEATENSDLDLFIVGKTSLDDSKEMRCLSNLDEICLKADLIKMTRELKIPDFDGDGRFLAHYSVSKLVKAIGAQDDDYVNTLTGRLLLFLESRPILGQEVYEETIRNVISAYWRDYEDHAQNFMPAYLTNDIIRLWRTFCVNYEARTIRSSEPAKAKGKVKNYKLKHSRMLTCYSALLYFLVIYKENGTVTREDAYEMTKKTPVERIQWVAEHGSAVGAHSDAKSLIEQYDKFLASTSSGDDAFKELLLDEKKGPFLMKESRVFGNLMYRTLSKIDEDNEFYRLIVV